MASTGCSSSKKCCRLLKLATESLHGALKLGCEDDNSAKADIGDNESMKAREKSIVIPLSTIVHHHLQRHYLSSVYQSNNHKVAPNTTIVSNEIKIQIVDKVLPIWDMYFNNLTENMMHNQGETFMFDKGTKETKQRKWKTDEKQEFSWSSAMTLDTSMVYKDELFLDSYRNTLIRNMPLRKSPCHSSIKEIKKLGKIISKFHKNYDLVLSLQLGMSYSIAKLNSLELRELTPSDFDPKEKFSTRFPCKGSKSARAHQSVGFWWKDYCPMVFRNLMNVFLMDPVDYMMAICGNNTLKELSSLGKSGSFFYLTQNSQFMIKTIKKSEAKALVRMLPNYYQHVRQHKNTLITRFYGVHSLKPLGGQKVRVVVMENLLWSKYHIHHRFDLKGSSYGRTTNEANGVITGTTTLKDLDLNFLFHLRRPLYRGLINQIKLDCEFLEAEGIMDYSLLVGLHFQDNVSMSKRGLSSLCASSQFSHLGGMPSDFLNATFTCEDHDQCQDDWKPLMRLGENMRARAEHVTRNKSDLIFPYGQGLTPRTCKLHDVILYFGIIDVFQDYNISKKLEHAYKSLQVDPNSISAVDPKLYSKRFQDFVSKIFVEDE